MSSSEDQQISDEEQEKSQQASSDEDQGNNAKDDSDDDNNAKDDSDDDNNAKDDSDDDNNAKDESDIENSVKNDSDDEIPQVSSKKQKIIKSSDSSDNNAKSDSDDEISQTISKKQRIAKSPDSESSAQGPGSPTQEDLFGDADDVRTSSSDEDAREKDHLGAAGGESPMQDDDDNEEKRHSPPAPIEETILNAEIPKISVDLGNQIHFVKFPNFLSVEPRAFDLDTFEDEVDEGDVLDEEGRSRLKLKVENTIRWRFALDEDGNLKKESNAKIVRWSDGSLSLYLGSEVFDVHTHPLQGDHHHLFVRQGTGLQGRSVFRTKLTFRPHSTDSFTHRKMTLSMADKTNKAQKVKVLPAVGKNPDAIKQELIKKEEERMRASARRESQQRRMRERTHGGGGRALSAAFLEPDMDEGDVSLSAIKNRYKSGAKDISVRRGGKGSSDEEESEEEEEEEESASDLDSRDGGHKKSTSKPSTTSKRIIESDEEDSESAGVGKSADQEAKRRSAHVITESDDD